MKKIFTILLVVVVALTMVLSLFGRNIFQQPNVSPTPEPEAQNQEPVTPPSTGTDLPTSVIVHYTSQGFSPSNITVNSGTVVNFKNETGDDAWIASNVHPAHTEYPEFDARRAYAPGTTYSFKFEKKGTWKYHDHLNPTKGGQVVVQ